MLGVGALDLWRQHATRRMGLPLAVPDQYSPPAAGGAHPNPYASVSQMEQYGAYSLANGLVQFYAGLSSFLFHASMTALGQRLDMAGVYMLVTSPSLYMLLRLGAFGPPASRAAHAAMLLATAVCGYAFYAYKWQLESHTGGSTNLVLDLVAIMATLIVRSLPFVALLCLRRVCNPADPRHHRRRCGCGCWGRRTRARRRPRGSAVQRGWRLGAWAMKTLRRARSAAATAAASPRAPRRALLARAAAMATGTAVGTHSRTAGCLVCCRCAR